jgi:hypothetical protein
MKMILPILTVLLSTSAFAGLEQAETLNCTSPVFSAGSKFTVTLNANGSAILVSSSPGTPTEKDQGQLVYQNLSATLTSIHSQCVGSTAMAPGSFASDARLAEFTTTVGSKVQIILNGVQSAVLSDGVCIPASCQ